LVGLVIVSHSNALANALVDLVKQVAETDLPLAAVGGVGENREEFGTAATDVAAAIEAVYSPDGVVVLMDLGSALLSAETALELIAEEMRPHIRLCEASIVEGAIAAGVQINLGSDVDAVCREACQALVSKVQQLTAPLEDTTGIPVLRESAGETETWQQRTLTINTFHGLHARPAARFVKTAATFDADVRVQKVPSSRAPVPATSLNSLATLGVLRGQQIVVSARGPQASSALDALQRLVDDELVDFDKGITEFSDLPLPTTDAADGLSGIPISGGVAVGPVYHLKASAPEIPNHRILNPRAEWERLLQALAVVRQTIQQRSKRLQRDLNVNQEIFDAHLLILQDPQLLKRTRQRIFDHQQNVALAWDSSIQEVAGAYNDLTDAYLRQRGADVLDIGRQVLFELLGSSGVEMLTFPEPVIVVARELSPNQTAQLDIDKVLGLITVVGGPTSHSAILARALGIPSVAGVDPAIFEVGDHTMVALDGFRGTVWVRPSSAVQADLQQRRIEWIDQHNELRRHCHQPAVTRDGHRIIISANLSNAAEAGLAAASGAEAVGLLRTEFFFITRNAPPPETEQVDTLRQIAASMGNVPILVRTLDIGGDKSIPYLNLPLEANPFLGVRAIRWSLRYPDLFRTQIRAILRAAYDIDIRVMFPMVSRLEEVDRAFEHLEAVHRALIAQNITHGWPIQTGIMIETPSAALLSESFAKRLDFFSIGTNDLTQYTLAADRNNPELSDYTDGLHPAVLRLIHHVVDAAHQQQKPVGVCGELAADITGVPVLMGLGVDELSMNPAAIPRVKALICKLDASESIQLAKDVVRADDVLTARRLATDYLTAQNMAF